MNLLNENIHQNVAHTQNGPIWEWRRPVPTKFSSLRRAVARGTIDQTRDRPTLRQLCALCAATSAAPISARATTSTVTYTATTLQVRSDSPRTSQVPLAGIAARSAPPRRLTSP